MPKTGSQGFDESVIGRFDYGCCIEWQFDCRRIAMASLVRGVSRMEKDRAAGRWRGKCSDWAGLKTPVWWETFHYELVKPIVEDYGMGTDTDTDTGTAFGAVYRSRLGHNQGQQGAPEIVVAFRGTMLRKLDLKADMQIVFHSLSSNKRYDVGLDAVREQVTKHGATAVCLAGHSKGAALALLMGRTLAEEGCFLETHLFNPPHPTLRTERPLFMPVAIPKKLTSAYDHLHNAAAKHLSHMLQDEHTRHGEVERFKSISGWFPHLYVNDHDSICSAYITYFEAQKHVPRLLAAWFPSILNPMPRSIRSIIRSSVLKVDSRPDHLIPSANLHINKPTNFFPNPHKAHKLTQWYDLNLTVEPIQVLLVPSND